MKTSLILKNVELTPDGILIRSVEVLDGVSGETLRPAILTQQLADFLKMIEIDTDSYFEIQKLRETNPAVMKIISEFNIDKMAITRLTAPTQPSVLHKLNT